MNKSTIHSIDTAPEAAKPFLEKVQGKFGFVPNILGAMAEAPATLEGYLTLTGIFEKSSLSPIERQLILLAVSRENECHFCVAAHSGGAIKAGLDDGEVEHLREGEALNDPKLEALHAFATALTVSRGHVGDKSLEAFMNAGYTRQQAYEVILGVAVKVMTNYVDALADVPLNDQLAPMKWVPPSRRAAE